MPNPAIQIPIPPQAQSLWLAALPIQEGQAVQKGQVLARLEGQGLEEILTSPEDGYIVGLHARPGQLVQPGQTLCYVCGQPSIPAAQPSPRAAIPVAPAFDPNALVIFGGGGHGKTVIDLVRAMGTYRIVGIFDDGLTLGKEVLGVPVLGGARDLAEWHDRGVHLAVNAVGGIGNVAVRIKIFELLEKAGFAFPTLVHPSAVVERSAVLEAGVQVCAHAYVGSAARVGFGTLINTGAIVHHDCVVGRVVNLSPGATLAGGVRVEDHAQIGMLATVNVQIIIGQGARLGNGCTVKANVPPGGRVWAGATWPPPRQASANKSD